MKTMTKQMSKLEANVQFEKDVKAAELEIKATLVPQLAFAQNNQALVPTLSYARRQSNASEVVSKENAKVKKGKK